MPIEQKKEEEERSRMYEAESQRGNEIEKEGKIRFMLVLMVFTQQPSA